MNVTVASILTAQLLISDINKMLPTANLSVSDVIDTQSLNDGFGFVSEITVFTLSPKGRDALGFARIITKSIAANNSNFDLGLENEMHETELNFYSNPEFESLRRSMKVAHFVYGDSAEASNGLAYLALEFVVGDVFHIYQSLPVDNVYEVIDELIKMRNFSIQHPEVIANYSNAAMDQLLRQGRTTEKINNRIIEAQKYLLHLKPELDILLNTANSIFGDFAEFMALRKSMARQPTLCHGDLWTPNIVWTESNRALAAVLDFQLLNTGSPTEDFVYLLHSALSIDDYRSRHLEILRHYYEEASQNDEQANLWTSFDEMRDKYEKTFVYCMTVLAPWYALNKQQLLSAANSTAASELFDDRLTFWIEETARLATKHFAR